MAAASNNEEGARIRQVRRGLLRPSGKFSLARLLALVTIASLVLAVVRWTRSPTLLDLTIWLGALITVLSIFGMFAQLTGHYEIWVGSLVTVCFYSGFVVFPQWADLHQPARALRFNSGITMDDFPIRVIVEAYGWRVTQFAAAAAAGALLGGVLAAFRYRRGKSISQRAASVEIQLPQSDDSP